MIKFIFSNLAWSCYFRVGLGRVVSACASVTMVARAIHRRARASVPPDGREDCVRKVSRATSVYKLLVCKKAGRHKKSLAKPPFSTVEDIYIIVV